MRTIIGSSLVALLSILAPLAVSADEPMAPMPAMHHHMEAVEAGAAPAHVIGASTPEQAAAIEKRAHELLEILHCTGSLPPASDDAYRAEPTGVTRTFNVVARHFTYDIDPLPFAVNQGDTVVLNVNSSDDAHGMAIDTYISSPQADIPKGQTKTLTFVANRSGDFTFFCTNSACGVGHSNMFGTLTVNAAAPAPAVTSFSPTTGPASGGTAVQITGTGFVSGAVVQFGNANAASTMFNSSTSLTAVTPAQPAGAVAVTVRNPDGGSGSRASFNFIAAPTVGAIDPASGLLAGGTNVTLTGSGFQSGAAVKVGGVAATGVVVVNAGTITFITPAHAAGAADVVVTNPDGQTATLAGGFTFVAPVTIVVSAVSPSSGGTEGGTTITITGSGFSGSPIVTVGGGVATNVTLVNATTITAKTVAHDQGAMDVVVTVGGSSGKLTRGFTYTPPAPVIPPHGRKHRSGKK